MSTFKHGEGSSLLLIGLSLAVLIVLVSYIEKREGKDRYDWCATQVEESGMDDKGKTEALKKCSRVSGFEP